MLLALATAASCTDGAFEPRQVDGTWVLRSIGGRVPPVIIGGTPGSGWTSLVADTVHLRADGSVVRTSYWWHGSASTTSRYDLADSGTWSVRGRSLVVRWRSAAEGSWPRDSAVMEITGSGMQATRLSWEDLGPSQPKVYSR